LRAFWNFEVNELSTAIGGGGKSYDRPGRQKQLLRRWVSLVSLYGDGSQQLWQLSDSTSVCVSDACSGFCTVAASESLRTSRRRRGGWNDDQCRQQFSAHCRAARPSPAGERFLV